MLFDDAPLVLFVSKRHLLYSPSLREYKRSRQERPFIRVHCVCDMLQGKGMEEEGRWSSEPAALAALAALATPAERRASAQQ